MKHLALTFALIVLIQADACDPQPAGQTGQRTAIRVYCPDGDISHFLGTYNQQLAGENIQFFQVSEPGDVTVRFGTRKAVHAGEAFVLLGEVRFNPHAPDATATLLHEMLHCAGVGHDDDPRSVMYKYAVQGEHEIRRLNALHIEALRRLAGISSMGRVGAQIGVKVWQSGQ